MGLRQPALREELEAIAEEFRHVREEHERAGAEGTVRRRHESTLADLDERFETLLARWVHGESLRAAWRRHLHHGEAAPAEPGPGAAPPLFVGRARALRLEVRELDDGACEVVVDGTPVERLTSGADFSTDSPVSYAHAGLEFREVFEAPPVALDALRDHVSDPSGEPPWEHAAALAADGLVDRDFSLTHRGRRALAG